MSPASKPDGLGASYPSDAACVEDRTQRHTLIAYAWVSDVGNRSARWAPLLRRAALTASAQLDDGARRAGGGAARMRLRCTNGVVDVVTIPLGLSSRQLTRQAMYDRAADALIAQDAIDTNVRALVYVDAPNPLGGTGGYTSTSGLAVPEGASKNAAENPNDAGGKLAILMRVSPTLPSWDAMLHEWLHTMGAVMNYGVAGAGPPNGSQGHCLDGFDIMCYDDGAPRAGRYYSPSQCRITMIDCRSDDYFAPNPAAGSWLATHWNIATDAPTWIDYAPPGAAPTERPTVSVKPISSQAVRVSWTPVAGASSYRVWCTSFSAGTAGETFLPGPRVTGTSAIVNPIAQYSRPRCRVYGEGPQLAAGPSSATTMPTTMPRVQPVRRTRVVGATGSTLTIAWDRSPQLHIARYEVWTGLSISQVRKRGSTTGTRFTIRGLRSRTSYPVRVVAFDGVGNFAYGAIIAARTR